MKSTFFGIAILSIVLDVLLGAWASIAWGGFAGFWFTEPASVAPVRIVGLVLGLALLFFAALQGFALQRIRSEEDEDGYRIFIGFGGYLVVSAVVTFLVANQIGSLRFGGFEFLLVDGLRGALLGGFAVLAMRAPATVTELKLPARAPRAQRPARRSSEVRRRGDDRANGTSRSSGRRGGRGRGAPDRGGEGGRGRRRRRRSGGGRTEGSKAGPSGADAPAA